MPPSTSFTPPPIPASMPPRTSTSSGPEYNPQTTILAVVIIIALVVGYFAWRQGLFGFSGSIGQGTRIEFQGPSGAVWYAVNGKTLSLASGPAGFEKTSLAVVEAAPSLANGDQPVLARISGEDGVAFGVLSKNGNFTSILADGTEKQGLFVRPDGLAVFATALPPETIASSTSKGPPPVIISTSTPATVWGVSLIALGETNLAAKSLGKGKPIGIAGDGTILAVATDGLVSINPFTNARHTLIASASSMLFGSVSGNGAALINPLTGFVDVYRINPLQPADVTYLYSIKSPATGVAFTGQDTLLVLGKNQSVESYAFSSAATTPAKPTTFTITASSK